MKTLAAALFALLIALPYILGGEWAPPPSEHYALPNASLPGLPGGVRLWAEGLRTLAATLAGAASAFWFNSRLQDHARKRQEKAATIHAVSALGSEYTDFLSLRRTWNEEVQRWRAMEPRFPRWLILRPFLHFLPDKYDFDLKAIVFMYEDPAGMQAAEALKFADTLHRDLIGNVRKFSELATRKMDLIEAAGYTRGENLVNGQTARSIVGDRMVTELETLIESLSKAFVANEELYIRASDQIYSAMKRRFGDQPMIRLAKPTEVASKA